MKDKIQDMCACEKDKRKRDNTPYVVFSRGIALLIMECHYFYDLSHSLTMNPRILHPNQCLLILTHFLYCCMLRNEVGSFDLSPPPFYCTFVLIYIPIPPLVPSILFHILSLYVVVHNWANICFCPRNVYFQIFLYFDFSCWG